MGFFSALRRSAEPEDEYYEEYEDEYGYEEEPEQGWEPEQVPQFSPRDDVQVMLVRPDRYEDASEIANYLRDMRMIVLNLERADGNTTRRLLDFLSGVAFAEDGSITKISSKTYVVAPNFVDVRGETLRDPFESKTQFR